MGVYDRHAVWYDGIYDAVGHDAVAEVDTIRTLLDERGVASRSLLDVACGTGRHAEAFRHHVPEVAGVDLSDAMLEVARQRLPGCELVRADFRSFDLGRTFDVVTCLFSAIGHVADEDELRQAVAAMAAHVAPGGLLVIETWLTPELVDPAGRRDAVTMPVDDGYVARLGRSVVDGDVLVVEFAWAVVTPGSAEVEIETHRMPLFTEAQYRAAVASAGLDAEWIAPGPLSTGRPLLLGRRSPAGA